MKEENKRKGIIYLIIGVITLLMLVAGAAYAYFQAQVGDGTSFDVNATTGTTDVLSFLMSDIDVSKDNQNIVDNHNRDGDQENEEIVINASQDNFGENDKSLGDGVSAKAILKANNTNNTASATYNVFFVMDKNDLTYTQGTEHPELILTVIGPDNGEIKTIDGLKYHNKDENNPNDVSGFDITGKTNGFAIKKGQEIEVKENTLNHQTTQEWQIKVTLVNLKENQNNNTGKEINGEVVITQEEIETYKLNEIKNINIDNKTTSSITTTLELEEKPTNEAVEYYFAKEEKGRVNAIAVEELVWEKELTPTHTFTDLRSDTNYIIYSYVVDSEGFRSNIYTTELIATDKTLPKITKLEVTDKSYDEISIEIESEEGDRGIKEYEYEISGATIEEPRIETTQDKTHTFKNLSEQQQYTIKVRAIDNDGDKSTDEVTIGKTRESYYHETCDTTLATCNLAKNITTDNNLIYHHAGYDFGNIPNADQIAEDDSYRYSGANYIISDMYQETYTKVDNELIKFSCNGEILNIGFTCASNNPQYYYLENEQGNHYNTYYEASQEALKKEYIKENVNNYICFGTSDKETCLNSNNDKYLYRIIGLFKNESNQYEMKLIKADYSTTNELGQDYDYDNTFSNKILPMPVWNWGVTKGNVPQNNIGSYYWNKATGNKKWDESNLNSKNLNKNYYGLFEINWQYKIVSHNWIVGGVYENTRNSNVKTFYNEEILNLSDNGIAEENIGLMYVSDYGYAAPSKYWKYPIINYGNEEILSQNWLFMNLWEWTIVPLADTTLNYAFMVGSGGDVSCQPVFDSSPFSSMAVRPVFYVSSTTKIKSGTGKISDPYMLSVE